MKELLEWSERFVTAVATVDRLGLIEGPVREMRLLMDEWEEKFEPMHALLISQQVRAEGDGLAV